MAMLQFPQPKLVEKTGEGTWRLTGRVILPEDGSLDRAAALLGEDYPALAAAEKVRGGAVRPGDLVVRLGQPEVLAGKTTFDEGFTVEVGASAELTAQSRRAAVYGLRTVFEAGSWPSAVSPTGPAQMSGASTWTRGGNTIRRTGSWSGSRTCPGTG